MRLIWTLLFTLASGLAFAASPGDDYIAARDKAIAEIAAQESANAAVETIDATNTKALADLQGRLSALLGPLAVEDFPANGTINLESLSDSDVGFGMLDGLRYAKSDEGPSISTRR
ncbi:type IV secretion system protein [Mesorhizobium sp. M3A.F.Ca.ET.201.01.1.1]|uniref:type IV secretion system protein n=1 Tax=Mesorhizobium sp. M3A.F.Ca.ET.201.01.1.1 TaxID=2563946 RepID=UPI001FEE34CD|nr:type IV secretion system protein [Mesorhizobium sp. M3A.F.Ca.ET.201.01.1.1]